MLITAEEGVFKLTYLLLSTATPTVLLGVAMLATKLHWRAWGSHLWEMKQNAHSNKQMLGNFQLNMSEMQWGVKNKKQISQNVIKTIFFITAQDWYSWNVVLPLYL